MKKLVAYAISEPTGEVSLGHDDVSLSPKISGMIGLVENNFEGAICSSLM